MSSCQLATDISNNNTNTRATEQQVMRLETKPCPSQKSLAGSFGQLREDILLHPDRQVAKEDLVSSIDELREHTLHVDGGLGE